MEKNMPSQMYQNKYLLTFEVLCTPLKANVQMWGITKTTPNPLPPK
jgi:hypothetical protein